MNSWILLAALNQLAPGIISSPALEQASVTTSITPPENLPLGGYTDRKGANSVPGGQELFVRSVTINGHVLAVAEMLTIPESLVDAVQRKLAPGIPFTLCATHTHCAPDSQMLNSKMNLSIPGIANFRRKWLDWYADRIAQNIESAWRSRSPVSEVMLQTSDVPLVRSRRSGSTVSTKATRINIIFSNKSYTYLDIYGAHPTIFDEKQLQLNGDWPGEMMRKSGGLCFTGPIGSASPNPLLYWGNAESKAKAFADTLDSFLRKAPIKVLEPEIEFLNFVGEKLEPVLPPNFAKDNGIAEVLAASVIRQFAPVQRTYSLLKIGSSLVVFVPAEPSYDVAINIEKYARTRGFKQVAVVSHANGWAGYVLPEREYLKGGYEGNLEFYGPKTAEKMVEEIIIGIKNLDAN